MSARVFGQTPATPDTARCFSPPPTPTTPEPAEPGRFAASCAATCRFLRCTGTGSRAWNAHACKLLPEQPQLDLPTCSTAGCTAVSVNRYLRGWLCATHAPRGVARCLGCGQWLTSTGGCSVCTKLAEAEL